MNNLYVLDRYTNKNLKIEKAIEVGNIFKLMDKFSKAFKFTFKDSDGKEKIVLMGCYGIGLGRLMGAIIEVYHDSKGIIWPKEIAPFKVHLIQIGNERNIEEITEKIYENLKKAKIEVLYDDRKEKSVGEKFTDCDLIGIPTRIIISPKTLEKKSAEIKKRAQKKIKLIKLNQLINYVQHNF